MEIIIPAAIWAATSIYTALTGIFTHWSRPHLARAFTITITARSLLLIGVLVFVVKLPVPYVLALFAVTATIGLAVEILGVHTAFPFGPYAYTQTLRPHIYKVPWQIALAWWMVTAPAAAVAAAISAAISPSLALTIPIAALLIAASDIFIDNTCVPIGMWHWTPRPGSRATGKNKIPISNYLGWFATAALIATLMLLIPPRTFTPAPALIVLFFIELTMQIIAFLFIWPWRSPRIALAGAILLGWPLLILLR